MLQFATAAARNPADSSTAGDCYVIKFFRSQAALEHEWALHMNEALKPVLPPLVTRYNEGEASAGGVALPPLIVTEAGETLEEVFASRRPDLFRTAEVRRRVCLCVVCTLCSLLHFRIRSAHSRSKKWTVWESNAVPAALVPA